MRLCSSSYSSLSAWYIISCIIKSFFIIPSRAYSSADCAGDVTVRRSTTGFCVFLAFISFRRKVRRRKSISRSSAEAECHAILLISEIDIGLRGVLFTPTPLYCDNRSDVLLPYENDSIISIALDPVGNWHTHKRDFSYPAASSQGSLSKMHTCRGDFVTLLKGEKLHLLFPRKDGKAPFQLTLSVH